MSSNANQQGVPEPRASDEWVIEHARRRAELDREAAAGSLEMQSQQHRHQQNPVLSAAVVVHRATAEPRRSAPVFRLPPARGPSSRQEVPISYGVTEYWSDQYMPCPSDQSEEEKEVVDWLARGDYSDVEKQDQ